MELIRWEDRFSVGVRSIDDQHKKMFSIVNELYTFMQSQSPDRIKEDLDKILDELVSYAQYHFSTEERFFVEFGYPGKEPHMAAHESYKEKVAAFINERDEKGFLLTYDILDFLENWWIGHVSRIDHNYAAFFQEHGLH